MSKQKVPRKKKELAPQTHADLQPRLYENLRKVICQLVNGKNYHAMSLREMMEKLQLPPQHLEIFEEALHSISKEGILHLNHGRYEVQKTPLNKTITGVIRVHFRGFGFVKPDAPTPYTEDIFIPKPFTMNAIDGDKVEVEVNPQISEKGPEGRVTAITSRSRTHVAGIILSTSSHGEIEAYAPLFGINRRILVESTPKNPLKKGDRIVMKVLDWGSKEGTTHCQFSSHIGHISDPSCDITAAIEEFGLLSSFPQKVLKEAEKCGTEVSKQDIAKREDLRDIECVTIDPDTAKDFDDAISLKKDSNGHYHLGVHIADVSHYVLEGSDLDLEARTRCNSTYFPGTCLPMLPPMLSENLCSLKPDVPRLTVSVFIHFDEKGSLINYRIARTVIKSAKRFTYREAKEVLDGKLQSVHAPLLHLMVELCGHLKLIRYDRGSIEFSLPDLIIKIDEKGVPTNVEYVAYDITHQMIEEFMLKANEIVALHLSKAGKGVAYRIHDEPSDDNMKDFVALANAFGFTLNDPPSARELQEFFYEALQTPYGEYLATSFIRRMRQALYSPENIGHYGLGLTHYCHFTSPIRRYVDLVVHRTIFEDKNHSTNLDAITQECSEQERISAKAESSVVLLKKLRLLGDIHKQDKFRQYDAVVTRVKQFGFSFEVIDYMLESFFHVSELDNDYFVYEEAGVKLRGRHTGRVYTAGERITVMLKDVDLLRLESKWELVSEKAVKYSDHKQTSHQPRDAYKSRQSEQEEYEPLAVAKGKPWSKGKPGTAKGAGKHSPRHKPKHSKHGPKKSLHGHKEPLAVSKDKPWSKAKPATKDINAGKHPAQTKPKYQETVSIPTSKEFILQELMKSSKAKTLLPSAKPVFNETSTAKPTPSFKPQSEDQIDAPKANQPIDKAPVIASQAPIEQSITKPEVKKAADVQPVAVTKPEPQAAKTLPKAKKAPAKAAKAPVKIVAQPIAKKAASVKPAISKVVQPVATKVASKTKAEIVKAPVKAIKAPKAVVKPVTKKAAALKPVAKKAVAVKPAVSKKAQPTAKKAPVAKKAAQKASPKAAVKPTTKKAAAVKTVVSKKAQPVAKKAAPKAKAVKAVVKPIAKKAAAVKAVVSKKAQAVSKKAAPKAKAVKAVVKPIAKKAAAVKQAVSKKAKPAAKKIAPKAKVAKAVKAVAKPIAKKAAAVKAAVSKKAKPAAKKIAAKAKAPIRKIVVKTSKSTKATTKPVAKKAAAVKQTVSKKAKPAAKKIAVKAKAPVKKTVVKTAKATKATAKPVAKKAAAVKQTVSKKAKPVAKKVAPKAKAAVKKVPAKTSKVTKGNVKVVSKKAAAVKPAASKKPQPTVKKVASKAKAIVKASKAKAIVKSTKPATKKTTPLKVPAKTTKKVVKTVSKKPAATAKTKRRKA